MTDLSRLTADPTLEEECAFKSSPLSFSQHQVWLSEQIDPGNTAYHIAECFSLTGDLQTQLLERAFNEVVNRHEALRTVFREEDEEPIQVIHAPRPLKLPIVDLSQLDEIDRGPALSDRIREEANRRFDLSSGPLIRPVIMRIDELRHYLLLVTHHIVCDGWSLGVLMSEVEHLYTGWVSGEPEPLPKLPMQYADFVSWQRQRLSGEEMERHLDYWRRRLAGVPPLLELPTDHPRPSSRSSGGARIGLMVPDGLTAQLRELSWRAGGTLFMTLLAGFNILLSRYTGRQDIVIGTPLAGRGRTEFEPLIGFFINTLVIRTDLSGEPTFLDVFKRVREGFLLGFEHQDIPIEMLVSELQMERSLSHTPLVQVLFNMLSFSVHSVKLPALQIKRLSSPETGSKFDLTLYAHESSGKLNLTLVYSADLFEEPRMHELLEQFMYLLGQIVESPNAGIAQYSLITSAGRNLLPDPATPLQSKWQCAYHDLFTQQACRTPAHPALIDAQRTWTYQELEARSNQLAHYLLAAGVQRGDPVAIYAHRSASLIWAMLGTLKAGAAFVILDPTYPEDRLLEYLRALKPRACLHVAAAGQLPSRLDNFFAGESVLCRLELHPDLLVDFSSFAPSVAVEPCDLAYIAFTSGSTGKPKGVMGTQDSLVHYSSWIQNTFGIGAADRFSMLSALSHDPLLRDVFTPLLLGAAVCIPDTELFGLPGALARWMNEVKISVCNLTPAMGQLLTEFSQESDPLKLTDLRHSFFVGDSLTSRDVSEFRKLAPYSSCVQLYGTTETQRALGYYVVPPEPDIAASTAGRKEVLPVGKGMNDVQLLVLNTERNLAGIGEVGEIYFRSPHLANGYWDDPVLTSERFVPNPFARLAGEQLYKTGDLGRYLPDGNLELLGRADRQVKIRGFRVEPAEIQSALKEHGSVRDCVVVARDHADGEKQLVAYVVPVTGVAPATGDLTHSLRQKLPTYMIPSAIVIIEDLPLTPTGKVDYQALPSPNQSPSELERGSNRDKTPIEEIIVGILAHQLKVEHVGVNDNFFDLGGHSLLAMQLLARMRSTLRVTVPLRELFETPTAAGLARAIERRLLSPVTAEVTPIPQLPPEPEAPLSFSQEGLLVREWWEEVNKVRRGQSQLSAAFHLTGPLNLPLLERAINEIVHRHEILRATFPHTGRLLRWKGLHVALRTLFASKAVHNKLIKLEHRASSELSSPKFTGGRKQIIRPQMTVPLTVIDLQSASNGERDAEISIILSGEMATPFNYATGPLLRAVVLRLAGQEHILHFVVHHLVCDAWSMNVLIGEVLTLYNALLEGKPSPLPELPIQYADFARWQRKWFRGDALEAKVSFWKEQFSGVGLFPKLPLPFIRSEQNSNDARRPVDTRKLAISGPLSKSLKALGHASGATTYMLFMAAMNVLLHRYTGVPKISIYTPFANRGRVETQGLIGWVSNVHVVCVDCSGNPTFSQLLERVREAVLGAYTHQAVPYLQLVKTLLRQEQGYTIPRSVSEAPYVFFDYVVQTHRLQQVGALTLNSFPSPPGSAAAGTAGLEVRAVEQDGQVVIRVKYAPDTVEAVHIEQMLSEFAQLLHGIARCPEERILELTLA